VSTTDDARLARVAARTGHALPGVSAAAGDAPAPAEPLAAPAPYGPFPPPVPPVPSGTGTHASRGHPGGPGFAAGHGEPPVPAQQPVRTVWQHAQHAWHVAGAEWQTASAGAARPGRRGWRAWLAPAGRTRRVLTAVAAVAAVAAGSGYAVSQAGGMPAGDYPAARLAGSLFGGPPPGRGISQAMNWVASFGGTTVAVASQAGGDIPRAQFLVSPDDGATWKLAPVSAPGGGAPAPGHAARLIAHGRAGWLAAGPDAIWTSATGRSWTLASAAGITPADTGDQVSVLTATARGYLAAGQNAAEGTAVAWTSADGLRWQRMTAAQLPLPAGDSAVADISGAAAHGSDILLSGHVVRSAAARTPAVWVSTNSGVSWTPAPLPVSHGATSGLAGIAAGGTGFVAVRPGTAAQGSGSQGDGVVYASADGTSWRYVATLGAVDGVQIGLVRGGPGGFAALGRGPGGDMAAYLSADGVSWGAGIPFGPAPVSVTGATVTAGGTVVVTGADGAAGSQRPFLALARPGQAARAVNLTGVPGGSVPQLSVRAVAVYGDQRVAVGERAGLPAVWAATGVSWSPGTWLSSSGTAPGGVSGPFPPAAPAADGQRLTSVARGPAGWLATGYSVSGAVRQPLVGTSADGVVWHAAAGAALPGSGPEAAQAAASQAGYVIVGSASTGAGTFPAAWWSGGLRTWARASAGGGAARAVPGQMRAVTAGPSGFVAVGRAGITPAAWTSRTGRVWAIRALPMPGGAAGAGLQHVAQAGRHVAAFGEATWPSGARTAFAGVSADAGRSWRLVSLPSPRGAATVTAVTAMRGGFTAAGTYGPDGEHNVVIWTSADGSRWTMQVPAGTGLSGPGVQEITGLAASGAALTGVGFTAAETGEQPTLWDVPARGR